MLIDNVIKYFESGEENGGKQAEGKCPRLGMHCVYLMPKIIYFHCLCFVIDF